MNFWFFSFRLWDKWIMNISAIKVMQTFDSSWLPKSFYVMNFASRKYQYFQIKVKSYSAFLVKKNVSIKKTISHVARRGHMYDNFKHKF